jgi:diguanylate cyclase (GGDEF)-like protein/PAS domain S-box-containing protein
MRDSKTVAPPALDESGQWFRALADATSSAIFVYRNKILYANRAGEALSGFDVEELREMQLGDLVEPESRELFDRGQPYALNGAGAQRFEIKFRPKSGRSRWVDFAAERAVFDGEPATVGTAIDITERKLAEIELARSRERLDLAQQVARSTSWEWVVGSGELSFSGRADEILGFPATDLVRSGSDFVRFIHPGDRTRFKRAMIRTLKGDELSIEIRTIAPNGDIRWLGERAQGIQDASGWTSKVIGVAHDITERKIAEEALFHEKERAQVTLASIADGVIRTDANGLIDYLNPVAQKLTGWNLAEAYGRPASDLYQVVDVSSGKRLLNPVDLCLQERRNVVYPGDRYLVHRNGAEFAIHDSAAPIRSRDGELLGAILVFRDLTHLRIVEREMLHLASHDPITGLINRREFEGRLTTALHSARADNRTHALGYLDLDRFKLVNDTCGHAAGDQMVQQVAAVITKSLRDRDALGRLGGDEFGILIEDCSLAEARELIDSVAADLRSFRFSWQDKIYTTTFSGGLVPISAASPDMASLLSAADAACYVAKESGGDRTHQYEPGDTALAERYGEMQWISRIHKAFDERRFFLYRQSIEPLKPDPDAPHLTELFVRIQDETGKMIEPGHFIPAAEKFGLISAIDRWVLRTALARLAAANGNAVDQRFAINVSGQSLSEKGFLAFVLGQFESTDVPPERVHFEITETSAIADLPNALRFISVLKGMGCRFVLDDFGKGLSSFSYLKNLPVDYLKIDGEFVRNLTSDPIQAALVGSIHDIGQVMGLLTIAEAVEDRETFEALREIGVDYVQGYYFSKPRLMEPLVPATSR